MPLTVSIIAPLDFQDDSLSVASELAGDEDLEDEEIEAAALHLNQDFLQMLPNVDPGPQSGTEAQEQGKEPSEPSSSSMHMPLTALLGPLPSAASLGLTDSIRHCITEDSQDGEWTKVVSNTLCIYNPLQRQRVEMTLTGKIYYLNNRNNNLFFLKFSHNVRANLCSNYINYEIIGGLL